MKYELRIRPAADADVDAAADYIAQDNLDAALRFYDAVDRACHRLCEHPKRFARYELDHPRLDGLRRCPVPGFRKHLIFYVIDRNTVEIVRVLHGARDLPSVLAAD